MSQSLARILVHLVFSTKNREPFIAPNHRDGCLHTWAARSTASTAR